MRIVQQLRRSDNGNTSVEFAFSFLIVVFLTFWMLELLLTVYAYHVMTDAAKEGVRYAVVHGSNNTAPSGPGDILPSGSPVCSYDAAVYDAVKKASDLSLHDNSTMTVTVCYLDGSSKPPSRVSVVVNYPLIPYFAFTGTPTVRATAQGNIVY